MLAKCGSKTFSSFAWVPISDEVAGAPLVHQELGSRPFYESSGHAVMIDVRVRDHQSTHLPDIDFACSQGGHKLVPAMIGGLVSLKDPAVHKGGAGRIEQQVSVHAFEALEWKPQDQAEDPGGGFALAVIDHPGSRWGYSWICSLITNETRTNTR